MIRLNGIQSYLRSVKGTSRVLTEILSASLVPRPIAALSSLGMGLCVHRHTELKLSGTLFAEVYNHSGYLTQS